MILMMIKPCLSCKQTFFFFHRFVRYIAYACFKMEASILFKASAHCTDTHYPHPALLLFSAPTPRLRSVQEVLSNSVIAETTRCLSASPFFFTSEQWRYSPISCFMPHPAHLLKSTVMKSVPYVVF